MIKIGYDTQDASEKLAYMGDEIQTRGLKKGLSAAARPIKAGMKALAPIRQGYLRKAIGQKSLSDSAKARIGIGAETPVVAVGAVRGRGHIAMFVEHGTRSHTIKGKLAFNNTVVTDVNHPGAKAKPFLQPAYDREIGTASSRFSDSIERFMKTL